ncbi:Fc.00g075660.m01.CDS01 [Cosmosporella sp. VM-42]
MAGCDMVVHPTVDKNPAGEFDDESPVLNRDQAQQVDRSHNKRCQTQTSDAARTSRLTENKRRYRARRKEYVSDLERRLAEAREQGIKATAEVQLAARKVVVDNGRLRELLRAAGFGDEDIEVWTRREHCRDNADGANCDRRREIEQKARRCVTITAGYRRVALEGEKISSSSKNNRKREMGQAGNILYSTDKPSNTEEPLGTEPDCSNSPDSDTTTIACLAPLTSEAPTTAQVKTHTCHDEQTMPCKLLSRLAENPATDITQISVPPGPVNPPQDAPYHGGDVECGKAHEMLMRYATSEEKMDSIARALEGGCTSTGKGGCVVKKNAIWEALDSMCV